MNFVDIWDISSGVMYSTANDLGALIGLFFRDNIPAGGTQLLDGQTLREMMEPVYINTDRASGFAIPFELEYFGNYLKQTKGGDVNGYSGKIVFVPDMKLGLVVQTNKESHSGAIADAMADILMSSWDQYMRANQPLPALPNNYQLYIGQYSAQGDITYIEFASNGPFKQLFINSGALGIESQPLEMLDQDGSTFRIVPAWNNSMGCFDVQVGGTYELVFFQFDASKGNIVSLTSPGLSFGQVFKKL